MFVLLFLLWLVLNGGWSLQIVGAGVLAVCSAAAFAALRSAASFLLYSIMAATDPKRPAGACFASCTCKQLNRCDFVG